ncbi:hypothetical protein HQR03_00285 [Psychrobacter okhotskensis]|uniref:hypothetical protein n=1 Tax=Psychrobacter okhotskensis TaxID=212403 RepID=UPI00156778FF|nr:hypothetical protein [Psychrobacter okhotskensis]NRD68977.1 hypothetical protein [Psychrobacter okhotskensis]
MDSIYFKLVIIVLLLAIPSYFLYRSKAKDAPKYRQLKTYANIAYDREEYYESSFKSAALYLFTVGSHEASVKSRHSYDNSYEQYSFIFNKVTELQERINLSISKLEQNIALIIRELKASSRLVNNTTTIKIAIEEVKNTEKIDRQVHMIEGLGFTKVARLKTWFPSFSIFIGIMAVLLAIMVIWFLLLALGGSGTTLISYLLVLAIMIIPTVAFSAFKSRSNIKKFNQQNDVLIEKRKSILDNLEKLENTIILLNTSNRELESYCNEIAIVNKEVTGVLYQDSAYIKAARKSKALFKKNDYSKEEIDLSDKINTVVDGLRREIAFSQLLG